MRWIDLQIIIDICDSVAFCVMPVLHKYSLLTLAVIVSV